MNNGLKTLLVKLSRYIACENEKHNSRLQFFMAPILNGWVHLQKHFYLISKQYTIILITGYNFCFRFQHDCRLKNANQLIFTGKS